MTVPPELRALAAMARANAWPVRLTPDGCVFEVTESSTFIAIFRRTGPGPAWCISAYTHVDRLDARSPGDLADLASMLAGRLAGDVVWELHNACDRLSDTEGEPHG